MQMRPEGSTVRPPAVAGLFYLADPSRLRAEVSELLAGAEQAAPPGPHTKALIAPHAGYTYSGAVAAVAFATLGAGTAQAVWRVVVIGPSHHAAFRGIAAPTVEAFATPLGRVPVDRESLSAVAGLRFVGLADEPHAPEHALEVELPFLQLRLGAFAPVPLLVCDADPQDVAEVLQRLWGGPEALLVVSSDLAHFHYQATARRRDAATAAAIERGDWADLGPGDACRFLAIAGLLVAAATRGLGTRRLALRNSGDTAGGSRERVVGYGAWAFDEVVR